MKGDREGRAKYCEHLDRPLAVQLASEVARSGLSSLGSWTDAGCHSEVRLLRWRRHLSPARLMECLQWVAAARSEAPSTLHPQTACSTGSFAGFNSF